MLMMTPIYDQLTVPETVLLCTALGSLALVILATIL
jgi:hypothetical protein